MRTLHRKMLRDLWGMRGQAAAIGFVIVAGVATYVCMTSVFESLQHTLDAYYAEYRFADGFVSVRRAPEHVAEAVRKIPGVHETYARVAAVANIEIPGFDEAVSATIVSIPEGLQPPLNRLFIRKGRLVEAGREDEVLLNEPFAEEHGLEPGDEFSAILNGKRKTLTVAGIALSPEFLIQVQPGTLFPDAKRYGVLWMGREALAAAYDMQGAFNDVAFSLAAGASLEDVLERVDLLLDPYGGQGAIGRSDQPSHFQLTEEFRQLQGMATLLPAIFLSVAAFLLNIVVTRVIHLQRQQIALLKAFGYGNREIVAHYLVLVLAIAGVGTVAGIAVGIWMGQGLGQIYLGFYRFPALEYSLSLRVVLVAALITAGASIAGVLHAVRRAVALPPAEAMQPAPPPVFRPTFVERLGLQRAFDPPSRIVLRNIERQPVKAALTVVGIASACGLLIMGTFSGDAFDYIIDVQFGISQREDMRVSFTDPASTAALHELQSLPGVRYAEPFRALPVRLRHEHRMYRTAIEGIPSNAYLRQVIDSRLRPIAPPPEGILLAEGLARILQAREGDWITVEVLEGRRNVRRAPVVAVAEQFIGLGAYMDLEAANRLAGGAAISGALLLIDSKDEQTLARVLRDRPKVATITSSERAIQSFREDWAATILVFTFILSLFAGAIAFGVIYNSARIALSERDRELASLRVLGFTQGEAAYVLLGEIALLVLLAIPLGMALGAAGAAFTVESVETDLMRIPLVLTGRVFAMAAGIVLLAAAASGFMIWRMLLRLDLIGVLKTRE